MTHALIGVITARAFTKVKHEKSVSHSLLYVAALAAAFPDIDYLWFWVNPYKFITEWHRGLTHSLVLLPAWSAIISTVSFFVLQRKIPFWTVYGYCSVGLLTHILADLITVYGIQLLAPLSERRFALSIAFDMDPWIGLICFLALVFGLNKRRNAVFGLIVIFTYISLLFYIQQGALAVIDTRIRTSQISTDKVYALPQPFMPFHWKLVIDRQTYYETAHLSLLGKATNLMDKLLAEINAIMPVFSTHRQLEKDHQQYKKTNNHLDNIAITDYRTMNQLEWHTISKHGDSQKNTGLALEVWQHDAFSQYRKFSTIPILYRIDTDPGSICIWYTDMRYIFPLMKPPFRFGMCRQQSSNYWQLYRLRRHTENIRQLIGS